MNSFRKGVTWYLLLFASLWTSGVCAVEIVAPESALPSTLIRVKAEGAEGAWMVQVVRNGRLESVDTELTASGGMVFVGATPDNYTLTFVYVVELEGGGYKPDILVKNILVGQPPKPVPPEPDPTPEPDPPDPEPISEPAFLIVLRDQSTITPTQTETLLQLRQSKEFSDGKTFLKIFDKGDTDVSGRESQAMQSYVRLAEGKWQYWFLVSSDGRVLHEGAVTDSKGVLELVK